MSSFQSASDERDQILRDTSQVFRLTIENVFHTLLGKDILVRVLPEKLLGCDEMSGLVTEQTLVLAAQARDGFESPIQLQVTGRDAVRIADLILVDFHREDEICRETDIETLKVYTDQILDYLAVELGMHFQTPFAFGAAEALVVESGQTPPLSWDSSDTLRVWSYDVRVAGESSLRLVFVLGVKDMDRLLAAKLRLLEKKARNQDSLPTEKDEARSLDRLMDIPVTLTVEIGQKRIPIRDILELAEGTVLDLDRMAGDPADILINNTLVARGEIVVVNDRFGVRLTEVIGPRERLTALGDAN